MMFVRDRCHYCRFFVNPDDLEYVRIARWMVCFHPECYRIFREKLLREYGFNF